MGSVGERAEKPHAVCVPYPAQGHITPMLKVAKLLHSRGFHITFVNTHYNRRRLLMARGPAAVDGLPHFRFHSIPDGLSPSDDDADADDDTTQHIPSLSKSTMTTCLPPFRDLLARLNADADVPPVSCIVSDGAMTFTLEAAEELAVPEVLLWTASACGFMGYVHFREVINKGLLPVKDDDAGALSNGYLDTAVGGLSGMPNVRLRDLPSFVRTSSPDDKFMVEFALHETGRASRASAIILNTFEDLERTVLGAMADILPPLYPIGPLSTMLSERLALAGSADSRALPAALGSNLWKEDAACLEWLEGRAPTASVVYVNFGSIAVMSNEQLVEFAWGLAASGKEFLWIIRPDLVKGDAAVLPEEFLEETKERGLLASWCPQEEVLGHPAVGGFLTHGGWNSVVESICSGVPMLCWPFFAEQPTNCRYACEEWGVGMEINADVRRAEVGALIGELMDGAKGKEMRRRALRWRQSAADAARPGGSSAVHFDELVEDVLLPRGMRR